MPITSSKESLLSFGNTIKFIDNWLQCFEVNYQNIIIIYKRKISEFFKTIPKQFPPKKPDDYKAKYPTTIRVICGEWFI